MYNFSLVLIIKKVIRAIPVTNDHWADEEMFNSCSNKFEEFSIFLSIGLSIRTNYSNLGRGARKHPGRFWKWWSLFRSFKWYTSFKVFFNNCWMALMPPDRGFFCFSLKRMRFSFSLTRFFTSEERVCEIPTFSRMY